MAVPQGSVNTATATKKTIHRRLQQVQEVRNTLGIDIQEEVGTKEEIQKLLNKALPLEIPAYHALAMKSTLVISWTKLRTLRRYYNAM